MQRLRLFGVALLAIFALTAVAAATASAEEGGLPSILPTPTSGAPAKFTSEGLAVQELQFEGITVKCKKLKNKGEFTGPRLGTVELKFNECSSSTGNKCKSQTGAVEEIIIPVADIHLVAFKKGAELVSGVVVILLKNNGTGKNEDLKITCGVLKLEVLGSVLGLADKFNTNEPLKSLEKVAKLTLLFHLKEGHQEFHSCELDKEFCEANPDILLLVSSGEPQKEGGEEAIDDITFEKEVEIHF